MKGIWNCTLGIGAAGLVLGGMAAVSPLLSDAAAQNGTTHCDPSAAACGQNPVLTGPPPPFVNIPSNCPAFLSTDKWTLDFLGGNSVGHGTINKNGDWGGGTAEGPAVLATSDGATQYSGHATVWGGGGQNSNPGGPPTNQSEGGETLHFNGSGPAGSISIHVHFHATTNNAGTPTAQVLDASVTCS